MLELILKLMFIRLIVTVKQKAEYDNFKTD